MAFIKSFFPSSKYDNVEKYELNDNIIKCFKYSNDYYLVGEMNIKNEYPLLSKNKYNEFLSDCLLKIYRLIHYLSKQFSKYNKIIVTIFIIFYIFGHWLNSNILIAHLQ